MALGKGLNSLIPKKKTRRGIRKQTGAGSEHDKVWRIPISDIIPNEEQPRKNFDHSNLENLVCSIKKHGVLQPVTVVEKIDGGYELVAGERRLRASQIAGLTTIPAIVRGATQQEKLELALVENIQRQDLNPIEEAFAYKRLIDEFGLTQREVAEQVGKSRSAIANIVRLLDLPEQIQKSLIDGKINFGQARALLGLKSEKKQLYLFKNFIKDGVTVRDVEYTVSKKRVLSHKGSVRRDPNLLAQEEIIEDRLGTKVRINMKGEKGTIVIYYSSREELKRLIEELS